MSRRQLEATIERFRPTLYFGVPTLYAHQLRTLETSQHDLSSLRACVSAGEPLPPDLFRRWQERTGLEILDGIGSTELLHIFISNRLGSAVPGTSGTPVPAYRARVLGDDGSEVARGETGRLWVVGASAARSYWNRPEQSAQTFRGEWTDTGDSYAVDEQGLFVYQGRGDDMLKVGGRWVSPTEIEACLVEHAQVLEAAVVGHANEDELVKAHAYVVPSSPSAASTSGTSKSSQTIPATVIWACTWRAASSTSSSRSLPNLFKSSMTLSRSSGSVIFGLSQRFRRCREGTVPACSGEPQRAAIVTPFQRRENANFRATTR